MQTMLQALAARRFDLIVNKQLRDPLRIHLVIKGTNAKDVGPEWLHDVTLLDIGEDFIEIVGNRNRMIAREQILEIQPVNF